MDKTLEKTIQEHITLWELSHTTEEINTMAHRLLVIQDFLEGVTRHNPPQLYKAPIDFGLTLLKDFDITLERLQIIKDILDRLSEVVQTWQKSQLPPAFREIVDLAYDTCGLLNCFPTNRVTRLGRRWDWCQKKLLAPVALKSRLFNRASFYLPISPKERQDAVKNAKQGCIDTLDLLRDYEKVNLSFAARIGHARDNLMSLIPLLDAYKE
ncbi:hypothetical protein [Helicobacter suis]|uniref:hypothetical protein n=1 Tax=Helicobacter suis TaxID=104628 RepID=UPI000CF0BD92|nr:hypothetical protein [Helicobacter suis]